MKPKPIFRAFLALASSALLAMSSANAQSTYIWDNSNVTGTPVATLDWFTGGSNSLGLWTGLVVPVSASDTVIKFFADTSTSLPNTNTTLATQVVNLNNGGSAFQLGTLELNGFGSTTSGALLTMTLQGDALNFSGLTGTISFNSRKNTSPATDPVINYNVNNNIQLGTASSASALTLTGSGDGSSPSTTTYNIGGSISELQAGGGSILKSGSSIVTINGALSISGAVTVSAGQLTLTNSTINASTMTVNGGTLILTANRNPASGSMTVNSGGILQIGNNTATSFNAGNYSGNISTGTGGTLRLWSSSSQEISGIISGSGVINKSYGGALTLSGANTYTGKSQFIPQNTSGFTVNVSSFNYVTSGDWAGHLTGSSLGMPTTVADGTINIGGNSQAGITLNYTGGGETTDRVVAVAWNGNSTQTISASGGGLLNFTSPFTAGSSGGTGSLVLTGAGNGQVNGITGSINTTGLSKTGAGTWTISGPSTFTQQTTVTAGILNLTSATALQNSPFNTASTLGTGSIGLRTTTTTLTLGGLTGANPLKGRFTTATGGPLNATGQGGYEGLTNLTLNTAASATHTYTGAIVDGATGMTLTKTGSGTQILTTAHSYTGTTFVNGGFLQLTGNTLVGGLSVSNGSLLSNSSFAGLSSVASGGVISPGASHGAIGQLTINNASASALTLNGSTSIFDLPALVTTPDQVVVTGGGGLVLTGTNTVLLQTPTTGVLPGTYDLMTFTGAHTGDGSLVFSNGSNTKGNATLSVSAGLVQLTVGAGGLAGTATYTGAGSGTLGSDGWNTGANWNTAAVPSGSTNVTLAPTGTQAVQVTGAATPSYIGDLMITPGVQLKIGNTTRVVSADNAFGTPGSTIIHMGSGSSIATRNGGTPTIPDILLLGDATVSLGESAQNSAGATFRSITGPYTFNLVTQSGNGATANSSLSAANSVSTLNISGGSSSGSVSADAAGSIGSANVGVSSFAKLILNYTGDITDNANPIRINNGTLELGTGAGVTAALSLPTRPIELNGSGGATINNPNTASSNAYTMTFGGGISSTAAGAKTLTLGAVNTGINTISGNIIDGATGTIALTKTGVGNWALSGTNTYSGKTTVGLAFPSPGQLIFQGKQAVSPNTTFQTGQNSGSTSRLVFLDDSAGLISLNNSWTFVAENRGDNTANAYIFVGNNSTGNGGNNASSTQTGSTIALGGFISAPSSTYAPVGETINITGANGYKLQLASIAFPNLTSKPSGINYTMTMNPTTAPVIVAGGVTPFASTNLNSTPIIALGGTATGNEIQGVIADPSNAGVGTSNPLRLTKTNSSTWTLSGNNAYTGTTTVSAGTLLMNGSLNVGSAVSVTAGTLGGTGTISGTVTIGNSSGSADAILAPGASSIESLATGNLTFNSDGRYAVELNGSLVTTDVTNVTGSVSLHASTSLTINVEGTLSASQQYLIISNDGVDPVGGAGAFASLAQDAVVGTFGGTELKISYTGGDGNDIVLYTDSTGSSAYDTWKAANAPGSNPNDDTDGDGVSNAVEFVLGGSSATNDRDKLPHVVTDGTNMTFTFKRKQSSIDPKTSVSIEVGTDLVNWNTAPSPYTVPDGVTAGPPVTVVKGVPADDDTITLTVAQDSPKKFARLKVVITP